MTAYDKDNQGVRKPLAMIRRRRIRSTQRKAVIDGMRPLSFRSDDYDLKVHTFHVFEADSDAAISLQTAGGTVNLTLSARLAIQLADALYRLIPPPPQLHSHRTTRTR